LRKLFPAHFIVCIITENRDKQNFVVSVVARALRSFFLLPQKKFAFYKSVLAVEYCTRKPLQASFLLHRFARRFSLLFCFRKKICILQIRARGEILREKTLASKFSRLYYNIENIILQPFKSSDTNKPKKEKLRQIVNQNKKFYTICCYYQQNSSNHLTRADANNSSPERRHSLIF